MLANIAVATHSVVAELRMVPNQPLTFSDDGKPRVEDEMIAYTWDKFLRTGDESWPARLPMTKAAVRAMDTVTAYAAGLPAKVKVDRFVVSGASKRGWTTWTTAAVDDRVGHHEPAGVVPVARLPEVSVARPEQQKKPDRSAAPKLHEPLPSRS